MIVTFLGTGTSQGVPVIGCKCEVCTSSNYKDKRLRSSILISTETTNVAIDCSPDFRQQMLRENVEDLDAILFTHHHKDHVAGMDDVRAFNYRWKKNMQIYCSDQTSIALKKEFPYVFTDKKYPGTPNVEINLIKNRPFKIQKTTITPIKVKHYMMSIFGFRIRDFVYLTDVSAISDIEKEKMKNADLIILDALRKTKHISHFNLDQAVALLEEVQPKRALLTHISHYMGLHNIINKDLPDHIQLAYDGQQITLS